MTRTMNQTQYLIFDVVPGTASARQIDIDPGTDLGSHPICVYSSRPGQGTPVQP